MSALYSAIGKHLLPTIKPLPLHCGAGSFAARGGNAIGNDVWLFVKIYFPIDDIHRSTLDLIVDPPDVFPHQSQRKKLHTGKEGDNQNGCRQAGGELDTDE